MTQNGMLSFSPCRGRTALLEEPWHCVFPLLASCLTQSFVFITIFSVWLPQLHPSVPLVFPKPASSPWWLSCQRLAFLQNMPAWCSPWTGCCKFSVCLSVCTVAHLFICSTVVHWFDTNSLAAIVDLEIWKIGSFLLFCLVSDCFVWF